MVRVRAATGGDFARLLRWVPDAPALYLLAGPSMTWPPTVEQFEEISTRPGLSAWVVEDEERPAAWGHFDLTLDGNSARLGRVIIDPRHRGQGLGLILIQAAVEKARDLGAADVRLAVVPDNHAAVTTYRRAGFEEIVDPERAQFMSMSYRIP